MKEATIKISIKSPMKKDLVFSLLFSKIMKAYDKALKGEKTRLDDDIAEAMEAGKIVVDADVDNRIIFYKMKGTDDEVKKWTKLTLRQRAVSRGIKKLIQIEVVK